MLDEQDRLIDGSGRRDRPMQQHLLLERDRELSGLLDLVSAAHLGVGSIALVSGEAGIGKTSLIDAFCRAAARDLTILKGAADPLTTPRPFGPFFDMARAGGAGFSEPFHSNLPHAELFDAIHTALSLMTPPPAIVIEDAHWADNATLDLLKYLGRRIPTLQCLLVVSYRDDEVSGDNPLTAALGALPQTRVHRFPLPPLTVDGVAELADCDVTSAEAITRLTNGNPFFVTEIRGAADSVPASIKDVFAEKLSRLPDAVRYFLECFSVAPKATPAGLLQRTFDEDAMALVSACVDEGFLVENDDRTFQFRHELARLAIYERTHRDLRRLSHERFFDALAAANDPASLDLQVHHANGAHNAAKVLRVAPLAAERASMLGAHGEALAHASTALRYIAHVKPEVAAPIWELWSGSACVSTSMGADLIDARTEAARLWMLVRRNDKAAENLRWRSRLHWYRCESVPANSVAHEAIGLLEQTRRGADAAMAAALRAQLLLLKLEMREAIAWGEKALLLARKESSLEPEVHALNTLGAARSHLNQPEGVALLQESLTLAETNRYGEHAAHDADIARAFLNLADHAVDFRKFELADRVLTAGVKRCAEIDFEAWVYQLHGCKAEMFLTQGRLDDARMLAERILAYPAATPRVLLRPNLVLARVASRTSAAEADNMLSECLKLAVESEETSYEISVRLAMIEHAFLTQDPACASIQLEALAAKNPDYLQTWHEGARQVWARHFLKRYNSSNYMKLPDCIQAELSGEQSDAINAYIEANLPYDAALCALRNAEPNNAAVLRGAIETLSDMGATAAAECAKSIARECNIDIRAPGSVRGPYASARRHPLGLTKREAEVLKFVAEGATNREISEKLHRSPRTIDQHVSSLLKKLNCSGRIEVVLRVANEPWILDGAPGRRGSGSD